MSRASFLGRPELILTGNLRTDTANIWRAITRLNDPPRLFLHGNEIVWLTEKAGALVAIKVDATSLRRFATDHIDFYKLKDAEKVSKNPTRDLFLNMLAGPSPGLPSLQRITHVPVFIPEGLITSRGYYPSARLYYDPEQGMEIPEVPEQPTSDHTGRAKDFLLNEFLPDSPFKNRASKPHALAAIIQPFVRSLIEEPTPLFPIVKPKAGTGGTLLAVESARIFCEPTLITLPATESEQAYTLLAVLRDLPKIVIVDNVKQIGGIALASVLTGDQLKG